MCILPTRKQYDHVICILIILFFLFHNAMFTLRNIYLLTYHMYFVYINMLAIK